MKFVEKLKKTKQDISHWTFWLISEVKNCKINFYQKAKVTENYKFCLQHICETFWILVRFACNKNPCNLQEFQRNFWFYSFSVHPVDFLNLRCLSLWQPHVQFVYHGTLCIARIFVILLRRSKSPERKNHLAFTFALGRFYLKFRKSFSKIIRYWMRKLTKKRDTALDNPSRRKSKNERPHSRFLHYTGGTNWVRSRHVWP